MEFIELDGSYCEGGGQIVRTALGLSVLTGKAFRVFDIRKGRSSPGVKPQLLHCIKAFEKMCGAKVVGAELGSMQLDFIPRKIKARTISLDIGTAGAITLVLQSLIILALFEGGKFRFKIKGGTNVSWSMPIEYFDQVLIPQLRRYADIELKIGKRGYYPKGLGEVDIKIKSKFSYEDIFNKSDKIPQIQLDDQGHLIQIMGVSHSSIELSNAEVSERQEISAQHVLNKLNVPVRISKEYCNTASIGCGITLWAIFSKQKDDIDFFNPIRIGTDALGKKGKKAELVGEEAAKRLRGEINKGAVVDENLCDNLIPFIALCGGQIKCDILSDHTLANIYVVEKFLKKQIKIENNIISCSFS